MTKSPSCIKKQDAVKKRLSNLDSLEAAYHELIKIGRSLPPMDPQYKTEENLIAGCQSSVYLQSQISPKGTIIFLAEADSLIASGMISVILEVYNDETPEDILKCEPDFIEEIGLPKILTPGRANGLASMLIHIKRRALHYIVELQKN